MGNLTPALLRMREARCGGLVPRPPVREPESWDLNLGIPAFTSTFSQGQSPNPFRNMMKAFPFLEKLRREQLHPPWTSSVLRTPPSSSLAVKLGRNALALGLRLSWKERETKGSRLQGPISLLLSASNADTQPPESCLPISSAHSRLESSSHCKAEPFFSRGFQPFSEHHPTVVLLLTPTVLLELFAFQVVTGSPRPMASRPRLCSIIYASFKCVSLWPSVTSSHLPGNLSVVGILLSCSSGPPQLLLTPTIRP